MEISNYTISSENNIRDALEWHTSANILCNYMREPEYLRKAIKNLALYPRYFEERLDYLEIPERESITFPMLCFCDIPLSKVGLHMKNYGQYGIALNKHSCLKKDIQPILYVNRQSRFCHDFATALRKAFSSNTPINPEWIELPNALLEQLLYTKPIDGFMRRNDDKPLNRFLFQDECEWRYIPQDLGELSLFIPPNYNNDKGKNMYSNILSKNIGSWFKFSIEDIEYIIVPDDIQAQKLIAYISRMRNFRDEGCWKMKDKQILISKIEVANKFEKNLV